MKCLTCNAEMTNNDIHEDEIRYECEKCQIIITLENKEDMKCEHEWIWSGSHDVYENGDEEGEPTHLIHGDTCASCSAMKWTQQKL